MSYITWIKRITQNKNATTIQRTSPPGILKRKKIVKFDSKIKVVIVNFVTNIMFGKRIPGKSVFQYKDFKIIY